MKKTLLLDPRMDGDKAISVAAALLLEGKLVAFPTETVYGLGASILQEAALQEVYAVKGRPLDNPFIVHISSLEKITPWVRSIPRQAELLLDAFAPGPLTVIVEKSPLVPAVVTAGLDTIALRIPANPIAMKLLEAVDVPIAAPSANISGKPSPTDYHHVLHDFNGKIDAVVAGERSEIGIESTVINAAVTPPVLLRPGTITAADIFEKTGIQCQKHSPQSGAAPLSPGMKYRHYAPAMPLRLFWAIENLEEALRLQPEALILSREIFPSTSKNKATLSEYTLYHELRNADSNQYPAIFVFLDNEVLRHEGLLNRLLKAAGTDENLGILSSGSTTKF